MSRIEKLSIAVTHEQAEAVREAVKDGDFASASEVVRDALRDWTDKRTRRAEAIRQVRKLWDDGLASGEPQPRRSVDAIIAAGRKRLADQD